MKSAALSLALAIACTSPCALAQDEAPFPTAAWSRTEARDETEGSLVERGRAVFVNWCSACHSRDTRNAPGTVSLAYKYEGEIPAALEDREDLTPELVELYVRDGVATMPFYRPTEISDADLEALGAYLSD